VPNPILALRDAMVALLVAQGKSASARYSPVTDSKQLRPAKWFVALNEDQIRSTHLTDRRDLILDVVYQQALPDATTANPVPLENNTWLDEQINAVDAFRAMFREGGSLRGVSLSNSVAIELMDMPLYMPNHLIEHSIFTSLTRIRFRYEG
jgi:hypothetical protein